MTVRLACELYHPEEPQARVEELLWAGEVEIRDGLTEIPIARPGGTQWMRPVRIRFRLLEADSVEELESMDTVLLSITFRRDEFRELLGG